jgi:hypothetical protein
VFKQRASYKVYLNGGRGKKGPSMDELRLRQAKKSSDLSQMANLVTKYTNESCFTTRILNLEGQEVFGSTKWMVDIAPRLEGDSHMHDRVNFFRSKVNTTSSGFVGSNIDVGEFSRIVGKIMRHLF